jgi:exonuclease III
MKDQINMVEINKFKLGNRLCRREAKNGGSCVVVREELNTKEVTYLKDLCAEKDFELSAVELIDLDCLLICMYGSPSTDIQNFIDKLEILLEKVQERRKKLIICGDWNINFPHVNDQVQELQSLLLSRNLINAVTSLTRITKSSASLIDVMIINKRYNEYLLEVWNLGYSDHLVWS